MIVSPGATSISALVLIVDDDGLSVTGLVAATFPTTYWFRAGAAATPITLSDLASATDPYSSGGVIELAAGRYRLDLPNAAVSAAGFIDIGGEASGKRLILLQAQTGKIAGTLASTDVTGTLAANITDKTGFKLASDGLAEITSWTANINGNLSGTIYGIDGLELASTDGRLWVLNENGDPLALQSTVNDLASSVAEIPAPPTAVEIRQEIDDNSTKLAAILEAEGEPKTLSSDYDAAKTAASQASVDVVSDLVAGTGGGGLTTQQDTTLTNILQLAQARNG